MVVLDYAYKDKELVFIDEVANGLACDCVCPECDNKLIACNNGDKQSHYFRHADSPEHEINTITRIHRLAQILIAKQFKFNYYFDGEAIAKRIFYDNGFPKYLNDFGVSYSKTKGTILNRTFVDGELERTKDNMRYDVYFKKEHLAVEIFITHAVSEEKKHIIKNNGDWCIELDLSNVDREISYDNLSKLLNTGIFSYQAFRYDEKSIPYKLYGDTSFKPFRYILDRQEVAVNRLNKETVPQPILLESFQAILSSPPFDATPQTRDLISAKILNDFDLLARYFDLYHPLSVIDKQYSLYMNFNYKTNEYNGMSLNGGDEQVLVGGIERSVNKIRIYKLNEEGIRIYVQ